MKEEELGRFLEKLSQPMISKETDEVLALIPNAVGADKDLNILAFLENSHLLFQNTFCIRPPTGRIVQRYCFGDYFWLFRFIRDSEMALWISLSKIKSNNDFSTEIIYKLHIFEFNYVKFIGGIQNYELLRGAGRWLINCEELFYAKYSKTHYGKILQPLADFFRKYKKGSRTKDKIWTQLKNLETGMKWFAEQGVVTAKIPPA